MTDYAIDTSVQFEPLERFDVPALAAAVEPWFNRSLCRVNDAVLRLGVVHGEFHWHHHDVEDELFYVLEGKLLIDVRQDGDERTLELAPGQGYVVPRRVVHRTRAPERTVMLMVEPATVTPTGDD